MQKRNPIAVALLPFITFGIYPLVWFVKTKRELVTKGANIPTSWLLIIPLANIYWVWKYSQGVEHVTNGKHETVINFILLYILGSIGQAILQDAFNKLDTAPATTTANATAPVANPLPPAATDPTTQQPAPQA